MRNARRENLRVKKGMQANRLKSYGSVRERFNALGNIACGDIRICEILWFLLDMVRIC